MSKICDQAFKCKVCTDSKYIDDKLLNIINHQGKAILSGRMAKVKNNNSEFWRGCRKIESLYTLLLGMQNSISTLKDYNSFLNN